MQSNLLKIGIVKYKQGIDPKLEKAFEEFLRKQIFSDYTCEFIVQDFKLTQSCDMAFFLYPAHSSERDPSGVRDDLLDASPKAKGHVFYTRFLNKEDTKKSEFIPDDDFPSGINVLNPKKAQRFRPSFSYSKNQKGDYEIDKREEWEALEKGAKTIAMSKKK
jgi:hypothetical protein